MEQIFRHTLSCVGYWKRLKSWANIFFFSFFREGKQKQKVCAQWYSSASQYFLWTIFIIFRSRDIELEPGKEFWKLLCFHFQIWIFYLYQPFFISIFIYLYQPFFISLTILYFKIRLQHNSIIFETISVLMMAAPQNAWDDYCSGNFEHGLKRAS